MHIHFETLVHQSKETVFKQFDVKLFQRLTPPLTKVELIQFDGCQVGDVVELNVKSILNTQHWVSKVIEYHEGEKEIYFVDKAQTMPYPLTFWRHKHIIREIEEGTLIIDDIKLEAKNKVVGFFFYPFIWLAMGYRKRVYKKVFK